MKLYYKDVYTLDDKWLGLDITVEEAEKSDFRIEACAKRFFRLRSGGKTLFWARQHYTHYGVCIVKTFAEEYIVPTITSQDIEDRKELQGVEWLRSWSRYFALTLKVNNFYYDGNWSIDAYIPCDGKWVYNHINDSNRSLKYFELDKSINDNHIQYVSWFYSNNNPLDFVSLRKVKENSGRLKWWRKKVREGNLPPIILLYISGLDTYIILDGHYRLMAAILEKKPPNILTIKPYKRYEYQIDVNKKDQILNSIKYRKRNRPLDADRENQLLIEAYKETEVYESHCTKSIQYSKEKCLGDMVTYLDSIKHVDFAQKFFDVTDGQGW